MEPKNAPLPWKVQLKKRRKLFLVSHLTRQLEFACGGVVR
jgi:hypothetical protein